MWWLSLRSEEHTSELQSRRDLVCRLLLEEKNATVDPSDGLTIIRWYSCFNYSFRELTHLHHWHQCQLVMGASVLSLFFFNASPPTQTYHLSLHDTLPL